MVFIQGFEIKSPYREVRAFSIHRTVCRVCLLLYPLGTIKRRDQSYREKPSLRGNRNLGRNKNKADILVQRSSHQCNVKSSSCIWESPCVRTGSMSVPVKYLDSSTPSHNLSRAVRSPIPRCRPAVIGCSSKICLSSLCRLASICCNSCSRSKIRLRLSRCSSRYCC